MKYPQSLFCWLGVGLIGGMIFLCLQQTPTVPIVWVRLSLLAVPATYAAIGTFGFVVERNSDESTTEGKNNYQSLVYFYPLIFIVSLSVTFSMWFFRVISTFSMWFFRVIFEVIAGRNNRLPPSVKKFTSPVHKFTDWVNDKLDGK